MRENFRAAAFQLSSESAEALNPAAWAQAREWNGNENVYIFGPVGTGKSFMALCMLQKKFQCGQRVGEVSAHRFAKATDRFDEGGRMLDAWKRVPFLFIDDMDKAAWNGERLAALWELLDERMVFRRRTIMTANVAARDLREMLRSQASRGSVSNYSLADATLDRMKPCATIELAGKSLR